MTFEDLQDFIEHRMRMSHVYQPVMLMELLQHGGSCTEEDVARALLSHDVCQVEYYEQIVRNMVGRVLRNHGIVSRDPKTRTYRLVGTEKLTTSQREELIAGCTEKLAAFLDARGDSAWSHRRKSAGYISGTLRYEVLKAAKFRCELCGVSADERGLEVDHILPRNSGGTDAFSNLQALCYSCNAMKRDRDDTDFRKVRASYEHRDPDCIFCLFPKERYIAENELGFAVEDAHPVTSGHVLVIAKRHVHSIFDLGRPEVNACIKLLEECRDRIRLADPGVSGFNLRINEGADAGQTINHCHWHLIPRCHGDIENLPDGARYTIPGKGP